MRVRAGALACLTVAAIAMEGCSSGSHPSASPSPTATGTSANALTGLGATAQNWKQAHGALNTHGFSLVKSTPFVYSFKRAFPATSQSAAEAIVKPLLPPDAKFVTQRKDQGCLRAFYVSNDMQAQAPGLGNQLSAYYYSGSGSYDPKKVTYAIVDDLGYTTARSCTDLTF
jgi:hypothetical protein